MREDPVDGPVAAVVAAGRRRRASARPGAVRLEGLGAEVERVCHLVRRRPAGRRGHRWLLAADGGAEMTGEETVDDEARLDGGAARRPTDLGVLTPIDDDSGRVRYSRAEVLAARLIGG